MKEIAKEEETLVRQFSCWLFGKDNATFELYLGKFEVLFWIESPYPEKYISAS